MGEGQQWIMPGPELVGRVSFYEDFPYAWWGDAGGGLADAAALDLTVGVNVEAQYSDISDVLSRKTATALRKAIRACWTTSLRSTRRSRWPEACAATPSATGRQVKP